MSSKNNSGEKTGYHDQYDQQEPNLEHKIKDAATTYLQCLENKDPALLDDLHAFTGNRRLSDKKALELRPDWVAQDTPITDWDRTAHFRNGDLPNWMKPGTEQAAMHMTDSFQEATDHMTPDERRQTAHQLSTLLTGPVTDQITAAERMNTFPVTDDYYDKQNDRMEAIQRNITEALTNNDLRMFYGGLEHMRGIQEEMNSLDKRRKYPQTYHQESPNMQRTDRNNYQNTDLSDPTSANPADRGMPEPSPHTDWQSQITTQNTTYNTVNPSDEKTQYQQYDDRESDTGHRMESTAANFIQDLGNKDPELLQDLNAYMENRHLSDEKALELRANWVPTDSPITDWDRTAHFRGEKLPPWMQPGIEHIDTASMNMTNSFKEITAYMTEHEERQAAEEFTTLLTGAIKEQLTAARNIQEFPVADNYHPMQQHMLEAAESNITYGLANDDSYRVYKGLEYMREIQEDMNILDAVMETQEDYTPITARATRHGWSASISSPPEHHGVTYRDIYDTGEKPTETADQLDTIIETQEITGELDALRFPQQQPEQPQGLRQRITSFFRR